MVQEIDVRLCATLRSRQAGPTLASGGHVGRASRSLSIERRAPTLSALPGFETGEYELTRARSDGCRYRGRATREGLPDSKLDWLLDAYAAWLTALQVILFAG